MRYDKWNDDYHDEEFLEEIYVKCQQLVGRHKTGKKNWHTLYMYVRVCERL